MVKPQAAGTMQYIEWLVLIDRAHRRYSLYTVGCWYNPCAVSGRTVYRIQCTAYLLALALIRMYVLFSVGAGEEYY